MMQLSDLPAPQTTLVIIAGASRWPHASQKFEDLEACQQAAEKMRQYFCESFGIPEKNVLWLFNDRQNAIEMDKRICEHIDEVREPPARDLIFYHVGHGEPAQGEKSLYLPVWATSAHNLEATSLRFADLAKTLKVKARSLRRFYILDCCFAFLGAPSAQGDLSATLFKATLDEVEIPTSGYAGLFSSDKSELSFTLPDQTNTFFTEALLQVLSQGNPHKPDNLSLKEVSDLLNTRLDALRKQYRERHSELVSLPHPQLYRGTAADVPLFLNRGWTTEVVIRDEVPTTMLQHTLEGHTNIAYMVAWSTGGKLLASGSRDKKVRIWDTSTGKVQYIFAHKDRVFCIAWSPDGKLLASGTREGDKKVRLWDPYTGTRLHVLEGHSHRINTVAWSPPDGKLLASGSGDATLRLWDPDKGTLLHILEGHTGAILCVAWSPDGRLLASGSSDGTIRLWDPDKGTLLHILKGHTQRVNAVAWSPDGKWLASGSNDGTVRLWEPVTPGHKPYILRGHKDGVLCVAWSPDGTLLASGSHDATVRLWDNEGKLLRILEGHTRTIWSMAWSPDGKWLASGSNNRDSYDAEVHIWRTRTWEPLVALSDLKGSLHVAWHPRFPLVATSGQRKEDIFIWHLDQERLFKAAPLPETIHYTNAKVVLVGQSGVGKTALGLVLTGRPYTEPDSTHGRYVWTFEQQEIALADGYKEMHETLLWDLAGQPGYHLIHQLHLNEVTVALVIFDARDENDPFSGVEYWCRALEQAQRVQGSSTLPIKKILVEARSDRGRVKASEQRIQEIVDKFGFDARVITSAKEGLGVKELQEVIRKNILWDTLPNVTSTVLFQNIKRILLERKEAKRCIVTEDDLYNVFLGAKDAPEASLKLRDQFGVRIGQLESAGLIKRLSFGHLVLLRPELLDSYASALTEAAKDEPDGLGCIAEEDVRKCHFRIPSDERIKDREQEKLLLIALIEEMLRSELALREGGLLIFPSQSTREKPDLPDPEGQRTVFEFEGPIQNIYATLAVRLSHSIFFKRKELWKNAITYTTKLRGICGLLLHDNSEGRGKLTLFFDQEASPETVANFEQFVQAHLQSHVGEGHFKRRRLFTCPNCQAQQPAQIVQSRRERGFNWLNCPVCDSKVNLADSEEGPPLESVTPTVEEMQRAADSQRDFDVFLSYNHRDKAAVKQIAEKLQAQGIRPWFDEWHLPPGSTWQDVLEQQIEHIEAIAVFVGKDGRGPWQNIEVQGFLADVMERKRRPIPVILENASQKFVPRFLRIFTWVDFNVRDPDPMEQLVWGITGRGEMDKEM